MKKYFYLFNYSFLTIVTYPFEILVTIVTPLVDIGFLALFWFMVSKYSDSPINFLNIIAYFILVQFVSIWTMDPGNLNLISMIGWRIKNGALSVNLIRPVKILPSLLFEQRGYYMIDMIYSVLLLAAAMMLIGNVSVSQVVFFVVFLIISFFMTFSISVLVSSFAFITKEVNSLRHSVSHLIRILSGAMVPLTFFPEKIHSILIYSPFPGLIYAPVNALQNNLPLSENLKTLSINLSWAIALFLLALFVWNRNLKKYEAVGI
jgi:ABC-2 type transport system permease protein